MARRGKGKAKGKGNRPLPLRASLREAELSNRIMHLVDTEKESGRTFNQALKEIRKKTDRVTRKNYVFTKARKADALQYWNTTDAFYSTKPKRIRSYRLHSRASARTIVNVPLYGHAPFNYRGVVKMRFWDCKTGELKIGDSGKEDGIQWKYVQFDSFGDVIDKRTRTYFDRPPTEAEAAKHGKLVPLTYGEMKDKFTNDARTMLVEEGKKETESQKCGEILGVYITVIARRRLFPR